MAGISSSSGLKITASGTLKYYLAKSSDEIRGLVKIIILAEVDLNLDYQTYALRVRLNSMAILWENLAVRIICQP